MGPKWPWLFIDNLIGMALTRKWRLYDKHWTQELLCWVNTIAGVSNHIVEQIKLQALTLHPQFLMDLNHTTFFFVNHTTYFHLPEAFL